ncbi:MAG: hypothetical protein ABL929_05035 [Ferruginibacter sp.]|nr:hypothetical protein [Ferruginibacter sp.]
MKTLAIILITIFCSCNCFKNCTNKKSNTKLQSNNNLLPDSLKALPICINELIVKMQTDSVTNPPNKIYSYTFNNKTVYYVPGVCCDNFSDLYDDSCKIIAHPDGGFTGKGDRKAPNFHDEKTNEKLVWADKRK